MYIALFLSFFFYEQLNFVEVSKQSFNPSFKSSDFGEIFESKLFNHFRDSYCGYPSSGICCYKTKYLVCKNLRQPGAKITSFMEDLNLKLLFKLERNHFDTLFFDV